jgi:hypothetical protein
MSAEAMKQRPRMKNLFLCSQKGLEKLMETYRANSTIRHTLNYYHAIISNFVNSKYDNSLFRRDEITAFYNDELTAELYSQWSEQWITAVLDVIGFLSDNAISQENIRILESLMTSIDSKTQGTFSKRCPG